MKRTLLALSMAALALPAAAATVTVLVKQTKVRKSPQHYAAALGSVALGAKLESGTEQAGWLQVSYKGGQGWLHESAVTRKAVKAGKGQSVGSEETTADELTLAGKGFNAEVEKAYRKEKTGADYAAVDAMEKKKTPEAELAAFMKRGGLLEAAP